MVDVPMKCAEKIAFPKQEQAEIKRKLLCLDFIAHRTFPSTAHNDNVAETLLAISALTGRVFSAELISSLLADATLSHPDAHFVRTYYGLIDSMLQPAVDAAVVDESRIMALADALRGAHKSVIGVSPALSELVEWFLVRPQADSVHPLLVAGIFIYEFFSHDTLDDYREEVMHLLVLMLLRRCGCCWLLQYTPARVMAADRVAYLRAIRSHSNAQSSVAQWLIYWIDTLYVAAMNACKVIAPAMPRTSPSYVSPLNERQLRILRFIERNQPVRKAAITAYMHKESVNTIKKDLLRLRELGYILTEGAPKAMLYYKS